VGERIKKVSRRMAGRQAGRQVGRQAGRWTEIQETETHGDAGTQARRHTGTQAQGQLSNKRTRRIDLMQQQFLLVTMRFVEGQPMARHRCSKSVARHRTRVFEVLCRANAAVSHPSFCKTRNKAVIGTDAWQAVAEWERTEAMSTWAK
jgi:hypothetical protein